MDSKKNSWSEEEQSSEFAAVPQTRGVRLIARLFPEADLRLNIGICTSSADGEEVLEVSHITNFSKVVARAVQINVLYLQMIVTQIIYLIIKSYNK